MAIPYSLGIVNVTAVADPVAAFDIIIVPLLLDPATVICRIVVSDASEEPVIDCPVPSSKCVSNILVPVAVAAFDMVILPSSSSPTILITVIIVFAGIPVPLIFAPTTKFFVVILLISTEPLTVFPVISNCLAS